MKTVLQELIKELETIKYLNTKTLQEMVFFDGVLAIIEAKYIEKEKNQILVAYDQGLYSGISGHHKFENGTMYYTETFNEAGS